jgi:hypothetical protein
MTTTVTRVTHSCALLDFDGQVLLTDPWFSEKAGYYRGEPLAFTPSTLPRLAAVIASHDHYDHYDVEIGPGGEPAVCGEVEIQLMGRYVRGVDQPTGPDHCPVDGVTGFEVFLHAAHVGVQGAPGAVTQDRVDDVVEEPAVPLWWRVGESGTYNHEAPADGAGSHGLDDVARARGVHRDRVATVACAQRRQHCLASGYRLVDSVPVRDRRPDRGECGVRDREGAVATGDCAYLVALRQGLLAH